MNYPFTCPKIDSNIEAFKSDLEAHIIDIIDDLCPMFNDSNLAKPLIAQYMDNIYLSAEQIFENVREVNSNIRSYVEDLLQERDEQISNLESSIEDLENTIESMN